MPRFIWSEGPIDGTASINTVRYDRADIMVERLLTAPELDELSSQLEDIMAELVGIIRAVDPTFLRVTY